MKKNDHEKCAMCLRKVGLSGRDHLTDTQKTFVSVYVYEAFWQDEMYLPKRLCSTLVLILHQTHDLSHPTMITES